MNCDADGQSLSPMYCGMYSCNGEVCSFCRKRSDSHDEKEWEQN